MAARARANVPELDELSDSSRCSVGKSMGNPSFHLHLYIIIGVCDDEQFNTVEYSVVDKIDVNKNMALTRVTGRSGNGEIRLAGISPVLKYDSPR